jgi:drug/metabolite transporter (DMT)-like permease
MKALKHGELSMLYPFVALSFVWVALISWRFFGETITSLKIAGIVAIIAGISFTGLGPGGRRPERMTGAMTGGT